MTKLFEPYQIKEFKLEPYNEQASVIFERVKELIVANTVASTVEHIGSTAVPGLAGKRTLNILIPCSSAEFSPLLGELEQLGFTVSPIHPPEPADRPMRVASITRNKESYNLHLHLTPEGSKDHQDALFFRDYLNSHPNKAREYLLLKQQAAKQYGQDLLSYHQAKDKFIKGILSIRHKAKDKNLGGYDDR